MNSRLGRREFLGGAGALPGIAAVAPITPALANLIIGDVHSTARLLGVSAGFVSATSQYQWSSDAARAGALGVSQVDLRFVTAVARRATGQWLRYSNGQPMVDLDVISDARLRAFYRAFAGWDISVIESFKEGKRSAGLHAGSKGPGVSSPVLNRCSGEDVPAACPPRYDSGLYWSTRQEVVNFLIASGYHYTADYAGQDGNDYTVQTVPPAAFPSCDVFGCFRSQRRIFGSGSSWSYNSQGLEPNPEIYFTYQWPDWWWGDYVIWWHQEYC